MKNKILDKNKVIAYILNDIQTKEEIWNLRGLNYPYNDNTYTKERTTSNTISESKEKTLKLIK